MKKTIDLTTITLATFATVPAPSVAPTGNDNSTPKRLLRHPAALLHHPDVVRSIEGTLLRHGVDRQELRDGVGEVQTRALEATKDRAKPTDVGAWKALCCTIAERMVIKDRQRDNKRSRFNAGLCDDADEHVPPERSRRTVGELIDMRRQLEVLRAQFEAGDMPDQGEVILEGAVDGLSDAEIGEELGLSKSTVKQRRLRIRTLFKAKLASLGLLVLMLLVAVLFSSPFVGMVAVRDLDPPPVPPPTMATTAGPEDRAAALRQQALEECHAGHWEACLQGLDAANALAPASEEGPELQEARARAERALEDRERELVAKPRP